MAVILNATIVYPLSYCSLRFIHGFGPAAGLLEAVRARIKSIEPDGQLYLRESNSSDVLNTLHHPSQNNIETREIDSVFIRHNNFARKKTLYHTRQQHQFHFLC